VTTGAQRGLGFFRFGCPSDGGFSLGLTS
jgi:hypothetical protein